MSDVDISRATVATLKWKTLVPDERIKIPVSKGRVTVDGEVYWQYQKESAQEAVVTWSASKGFTTRSWCSRGRRRPRSSPISRPPGGAEQGRMRRRSVWRSTAAN